MLEKLVNKRNLILLVFAGILFVFWLLFLIFGNSEDKIQLLILTPILPVVVYGFLRLGFKLVRINASAGFLNFAVWFFLITGTLALVMSVNHFITEFPNGLSPAFGVVLSLIIAMLDEAKKNIGTNDKQ